MEPLEREILNRLAKVREHEETNTNLNAIWRECGGVTPRDFAQAWGSLAAGEMVHGGVYESAGRNEGLGKSTSQREEALKAWVLCSEKKRLRAQASLPVDAGKPY